MWELLCGHGTGARDVEVAGRLVALEGRTVEVGKSHSTLRLREETLHNVITDEFEASDLAKWVRVLPRAIRRRALNDTTRAGVCVYEL